MITVDSYQQKQLFSYHGKTGIAKTKGFRKKLLAEYAVNIGNLCHFSCTFCYVPAVTRKQRSVQNILSQGHHFEDFSLYRDRQNVLDFVRKDLTKVDPSDRSTVIFCTTCDPCATLEHVITTTKAVRLIMEESNLVVRILSKSALLKDAALILGDHKGRIIYSLSTGTSLPEVSAAIEKGATPIDQRVEVVHWLQDNGFRTYGTICPVLPFEIGRVAQLLDQVRPDRCEHVWVEALNVRGSSLARTYDALVSSNLKAYANVLHEAMGNKENWVDYSKKLFMAFQTEMRNRGQLQKLRYLQYVTKVDRDFFRNERGALCI